MSDPGPESTLAVCGSGTMGSGIAQLAATAGFSVILFDSSSRALDRGMDLIGNSLRQMVEKGSVKAHDLPDILERINPSTRLEDCQAGWCLEAILEDLSAKTELFIRLMNLNGPRSIYATNTSSLSVTRIAAGTPLPQKMVGLHFFNPAQLMKLVELIRTDLTEPGVLESFRRLAGKLGKTTVEVKDTPGFIVNRVARPFYLESMRLAEEGVDIGTIDHLLESTGFRMGPFALTDLIGQDINLKTSQSLYEAFDHAPRFIPSRLQEEKVRSGDLGRKTGRGFYDYPSGNP